MQTGSEPYKYAQSAITFRRPGGAMSPNEQAVRQDAAEPNK